MAEGCVRCDADAAWELLTKGEEVTVCARHLQQVLSDVPRGVRFDIRGLAP
jgi:hypothetical protein